MPLPGRVTFRGPRQAATLPIDLFAVYVKTQWSDAGGWTYAPYLTPISASLATWPSSGSATLRYDYGVGKREDWVTVGPANLTTRRNLHVAIVTFPGEAPLFPICTWVGFIPMEQLNVFGRRTFAGREVPKGEQILTAHSYDFLLDRRHVIGSKCFEPGDDPEADLRTIGRTMPFNVRPRGGGTLIGNRSLVKATEDGDEVSYVFGREVDSETRKVPLWSARDIAEYVLHYSYDDEEGVQPRFLLSGPDDPDSPDPQVDVLAMLDTLYPAFDPGQQSVRRILGQIIDRRRGINAHIRWQVNSQGLPTTDPLYIQVTSMSPDFGQVGNAIFPANRNTEQVQLDEAVDIDSAKWETDAVAQFTEIVVLGKPVLSCFSAATEALTQSLGLARIAPAWPAVREADYDTQSDAARRLPKFDRVYRMFKLVKTTAPALPFDWKTFGQNPPEWLNPDFDNFGVVQTSSADFFNGMHGLERRLPLWEDYGFVNEDADVVGRQLEAIAFVEIMDSDGEPTGNWTLAHDPIHPDDTVGASEPILGNVSGRVTPQLDALEIDVQFSPPHILGKNHFTGDTSHEPVFDYDRMIVTLAVRGDSRPRVRQFLSSADNGALWGHVGIIEVDEAEVWIIPPSTVIGVRDDFTLANFAGPWIDEATYTVRDDTDLLRQYAALAVAWHGKPRNKLTLTRKRIHHTNEVGSIIAALFVPSGQSAIGTPVTEVSYDFEGRTTTWMTGHAELDVTEL